MAEAGSPQATHRQPRWCGAGEDRDRLDWRPPAAAQYRRPSHSQPRRAPTCWTDCCQARSKTAQEQEHCLATPEASPIQSSQVANACACIKQHSCSTWSCCRLTQSDAQPCVDHVCQLIDSDCCWMHMTCQASRCHWPRGCTALCAQADKLGRQDGSAKGPGKRMQPVARLLCARVC